MVPLGELHPDTGLCAHRVELYATRVEAVGALDEGEAIHRAVAVSPAEAEAMVADGRITDGFTIAVLYRARLAGLFSPTEEERRYGLTVRPPGVRRRPPVVLEPGTP